MHMVEVFLTLWQFLNYDFVVGGVAFSLWNVVEAGIILSIIGLAIGKIFFFVLNKR